MSGDVKHRPVKDHADGNDWVTVQGDAAGLGAENRVKGGVIGHFAKLNDMPSAKSFGVGTAQVGKYQYASNGISWTPLNGGPIPFNTVCFIGDSFTLRSVGTEAYGGIKWLNALLGQRMEILNIDGATGSGAIMAGSSTKYASRLQNSVLAYNPAYCGVQVSVNDFNNTKTLADLKAAYSDVFKTLNDNGIKILTNTCNPTNEITTAAQRLIWLEFNKWLLTTAPTIYDMLVSDESYVNKLDGGEVNELDTSWSSGDSQHPHVNGMVNIAVSKLDQFLAEFTNTPKIDLIGISQTGIDANAISLNPFNNGKTGTMFNASNTGVCADGMQGAALSGTAVWSIKKRTDHPSNWQKVVWTPAALGQYLQYAIPSATRSRALNAGTQAGDEVEFLFEIMVPSDTAAADVAIPACKVTFDGPGTTIDLFTSNSLNPAVGLTNLHFVLSTGKFTLTESITGILYLFRMYSRTLNAQTYYFGRHGLINHSR